MERVDLYCVMEVPKIRPDELERVQTKFPDRLPVVVTRSVLNDKNVPELKKRKFLVPNTFVYADLIYSIRKWLRLPPEKAIFLFVIPPEKKNEFLPSPSSLLLDIHLANRHSNGVLYVSYSGESTFGGLLGGL
jgi:GABA(A) receptor-associated protein